MIPFLFTMMMLLRALSTLLKDPKFRSLLFLVILTLTSGTIFYHSIEGWGWLDSLYFSVITLTTVGYGDFTPQTSLGKVFTIFYIFLGLGILVGFVTPIGEYLIDRRMERVNKRMREKEKSETESETESNTEFDTESETESETEFETELNFSGVVGKLKGKK